MAFAPGYSPDGVRGGFATQDIPAGGVVASIPMNMTFMFPPRWKSFVRLGEMLALEAADPSSRYRPYLQSMPTLSNPHATLTWESFPPEYMHLLQGAAPVAERVITMQGATQRFWSRNGLRLAERGVMLRQLRGALVTITTRWYHGPEEGGGAKPRMALIPAYDLLNHRNGCPVHYDFEPCRRPGLSAATCCVVRTGARIAAGEEVCNSYNHLFPDLALFHYGFELAAHPGSNLNPSAHPRGPGGAGASGDAAAAAAAAEEEEEAPAMSLIDSPNFDPSDLRHAHEAPRPPFTGSLPQLIAERNRVAALLALLRQHQPAAERTAQARGDPGGEVLALILRWRRRRAAALAAEAARLERLIAAAPPGGGGGEV
ncbi:MAG: hypothetical protein J3K34DRAFT_514381 [Monoraphidium minutum]|nr:MAG: hypothetical protein J3K34DRAFT_514381 [Monoraphidium minutum]